MKFRNVSGSLLLADFLVLFANYVGEQHLTLYNALVVAPKLFRGATIIFRF